MATGDTQTSRAKAGHPAEEKNTKYNKPRLTLVEQAEDGKTGAEAEGHLAGEVEMDNVVTTSRKPQSENTDKRQDRKKVKMNVRSKCTNYLKEIILSEMV